METTFIYLINLVTAMVMAAQLVPTPAPAPVKDLKPAMTLTGCARQDAPGFYKFSDERTGTTYRLSGDDVRTSARPWGEIVVGSGARRVTIRGGLVPSPNMAAQAGAVDPARVAVAGMPGGPNSGTGNPQLPEFHVTRGQASTGPCP